MDLLIVNEELGQRMLLSLEGEGPFTLGRSERCDVVLDSRSVSRRHAILTRLPDGSFEILNQSLYGLTVRGAELHRQGDSIGLIAGDDFRVGIFTLAILGADVDGGARGRRVLYAELLKEIHHGLIQRIDYRIDPTGRVSDQSLGDRVDQVLDVITRELGDRIPDWVDLARLKTDVRAETLGLGPIEDLLRDPRISEIMVVKPDRIYTETGGRLKLTDRQFTSESAIVEVIRRIVSPLGRRIDESQPQVDTRLPFEKTTYRVHAIIRPLALNGPTITIRKFPESPLTVEDLIEFGTMTPALAVFLKACVRGKKNILISGGTGSGKTTLLNVLSAFIGSEERIVTIEDSAELKLMQSHVVSLQARSANIEGKGQVTIRDLVVSALRMRPDRIVVGECRRGEALDMLQAMNTGHDGSLTTGHANSPEGMMRRLETMVHMAGEKLPTSAIRQQIVTAVDLVVQMRRLSDGSRRITHVTQATGVDPDSGDIILDDIFRMPASEKKSADSARNLRFTGYVPNFLEDLCNDGHLTIEEFFAIR